MYVCICKAVTDSQIKNAIDNGACTRKQVFDTLGVGRNCGKCNSQIKELLDGNRRQQSIMQASPNEPILNAY